MISSTTPTGDQARQNFLIDRVESFLILLLIEDLMAAHSCFGMKETFFFHFFPVFRLWLPEVSSWFSGCPYTHAYMGNPD